MNIYKITNTNNGKIYIGKTTKTIEQRFEKHCYNSKSMNTHLYKSMRKHGVDNFIIEVIEEDSNDEREIYWISEMGSLAPNGYNLTIGGEGGDTSMSPNYIEAMKKRDMKGKNNPMYGRDRTGGVITKETRVLISKAQKENWDTNPDRKQKASDRVVGKNNPMYGKTPSNAVKVVFEGFEYESLASASRMTGHSVHYIKKCGEVSK